MDLYRVVTREHGVRTPPHGTWNHQPHIVNPGWTQPGHHSQKANEKNGDSSADVPTPKHYLNLLLTPRLTHQQRNNLNSRNHPYPILHNLNKHQKPSAENRKPTHTHYHGQQSELSGNGTSMDSDAHGKTEIFKDSYANITPMSLSSQKRKQTSGVHSK